MRFYVTIKLAILLIVILTCGQLMAQKGKGYMEPTKTITGKIKFTEIEGGIWFIETDSANYVPDSLPEPFKKEGFRVEAEIQEQKNIMSFRMFGIPVKLIAIREKQINKE